MMKRICDHAHIKEFFLLSSIFRFAALEILQRRDYIVITRTMNIYTTPKI